MAAGTVSFDIVGTLFGLDAPRRVLTQHGAPTPTFEVWFSGALRDYFARSHSGPYTPLKEVLEDTLERAGAVVGWDVDKGVTPEVMQSLRELAPVEGAKTALDRLADAGWKKIAVTNSSRDLVEDLLARAGLAGHFERVISCDDLDVGKPHPRVYEEAKRHSDGDPWLMAAHAWDVAGAMEAGMRAAWVSSHERIYPDFLPAPDVTADDLDSAVTSVLALYRGGS